MAPIAKSAKSRRLAGILVAALLATAMAGPASAATPPISIKITDARLTARIQVTLGFDVVCQPLVSAIDGSQVTIAAVGYGASVDQANGRTIAHAEGGDLMPDPSRLVTCDGSTVNHLTVTMLSSTVPFHGGTAIASVRVTVDDAACVFCGSARRSETTSAVKLAR